MIDGLKDENIDKDKNIEGASESNENSDDLGNFSGELENLKNLIKKEALKKKEYSEEIKNKSDLDKIDRFFEQGKEEFEDINTPIEEELIIKRGIIKDNIKNRPKLVVKAIVDSADKILDEIYNREQEKDLVARSLLRIVNWIMKLEK